jgi:hypothetical protein
MGAGNAATHPGCLPGLRTGWVACRLTERDQFGKALLLAVSRNDRNVSAEQLRIGPSGSFESRMKIRRPGAVATSTHSPFPALRLALRQERPSSSPKKVIGMFLPSIAHGNSF